MTQPNTNAMHFYNNESPSFLHYPKIGDTVRMIGAPKDPITGLVEGRSVHQTPSGESCEVWVRWRGFDGGPYATTIAINSRFVQVVE